MNLGEAKEVFANHLEELMRNSKDGDRTVKALQLIQEHLQQTIYDEHEIEEYSCGYLTVRYYEGGLLVKEEVRMRGE